MTTLVNATSWGVMSETEVHLNTINRRHSAIVFNMKSKESSSSTVQDTNTSITTSDGAVNSTLCLTDETKQANQYYGQVILDGVILGVFFFLSSHSQTL